MDKKQQHYRDIVLEVMRQSQVQFIMIERSKEPMPSECTTDDLRYLEAHMRGMELMAELIIEGGVNIMKVKCDRN